MEIALSRRAKQSAQDTMIRFALFNASGFGLCGGPMVCLLALSYGAGDMQMGFLYAGIYLMNFTAMLVPSLFGGRETSSILKGSIWFRSIVTGLYPVLLLLSSANAKIWWIIIVYFLFLLGRGFSLSAFFPVYKSISSARDVAGFFGRIFSTFNMGILFASTLCFVVMQYLVPSVVWLNEEKAFVLLLFLGFVLNLCACLRLAALPPTGYLDEGTFASIGRACSRVFSDPVLRGVMVLSMVQTAQAISAAYMMSFLKNVMRMTSGYIFLLTVVGYLSGIGISQVIRIVGVRISSRAILLSTHVLLAIMGLVWAMVDRLGITSAGWFALLYGLSMLGLTASASVVFKLQTASLPKQNSMQVTIVIQIATTIAALLAIASNKLLPNVFVFIGEAIGHAYTPSFLLWSFLSLLIVVVSIVFLRNEEDERTSLAADLSTLSPSNLFNIFRAYRIGDDTRNLLTQHNMEGIMMQPTQSSRSMLVEWMMSADFRQRLSALRTLNHTQTPELFELVYTEAMDPDSPLRSEAITTLGLMGNPAAVNDLEVCLGDASSRIRAAAIKSLLRLGKNFDDEFILRQFESCSNNRQRLDILIGIAAVMRRELAFKVLALELKKHPAPSWSSTLFAYVAEIDNRRETMLEMLNEERKTAGSGIDYLLAEMEHDLPEYLSADEIRGLCAGGHYRELAERLQRYAPVRWLEIYDRTTALGCMLLWDLCAGRGAGDCGNA